MGGRSGWFPESKEDPGRKHRLSTISPGKVPLRTIRFISFQADSGCMKAIVCMGILVLALLACGCTTAPQETPPPVPEIPSLLGNWSGTSTGYIGGMGFIDYSGGAITMRVTEQKDRIFFGEFLVTNQSGNVMTFGFGGAIGRDGTTLTIVERNGGYSFGTLIAPDEIELIHADDSEPSDVAIDTLRKR